MVVGLLVVKAVQQMLENSPQGGKAGIVDDDGLVAAEAQDLPDEGGEIVDIDLLDRALGLDFVLERLSQRREFVNRVQAPLSVTGSGPMTRSYFALRS
jgi:hypothetical protein